MRILSFELHDGDGWTLEPMKLDAFNLLVGLSGAGKTRIVRAIEHVCAWALGTSDNTSAAPGASYKIAFEHGGLTYRWAVEFEREAGLPRLRTERIERGGHPLVERSPEHFIFNGEPIPKLDRGRSAIALLTEDTAMSPLHTAFSRCVCQALNVTPTPGTRSTTSLDKLRQQYGSLPTLGADFSLPIHHKAELLQELFPAAFAEITESFRDAFPLVEKLWVTRIDWGEDYSIVLTARESGVAGDFFFDRMSSGMQRYLSFLVHLSFAPHGTVVLIDELESSFGINCLPAAIRFLLRRAPDLQLILTSHHPSIIEKIPTDLWKIVTRKGSHVRVLDAAAIPALEESRSHLDRFTRLINLPEYEQGIQA